MSEIVVVALDINRNDDDFAAFDRLTAIEKIDLIKSRIRSIAEDLKNKEPNAAWFVAWREYGITEGVDQRAVSPEVKAYFKKEMSQLARDYPNLTIVAGTISTKKHFASKEEKLADLEKHYSAHAWVKEMEEKTKLDDQKQIKREERKIQVLVNSAQEELNVVRNTCYVFSGVGIWRHDKITPKDEVRKNVGLENAIFQPGKGKNLNSLCMIRHPLDNKPISFGVEICREHDFAVLKKVSEGDRPFLHFVMSDSTDLKLDHLHGDYVMQLDSKYKPRLILAKDEQRQNVPTHFYQNNLVKNDPTLLGPLQPVYPFETKVLEKLDSMIAVVSQEKRKILEEIKKAFIKSSEEMGNYSIGSYETLEKLFKKYHKQLKNDYFIPSLSIFREGADLESMIKDLLNLVKAEKINNPLFKDYMAMTDAEPLPPVHSQKDMKYSG